MGAKVVLSPTGALRSGGFHLLFIDFKCDFFGKSRFYMLALVKTPLPNLVRCTKEFFSAVLSMDKNTKDGN